MITGKRPGVTFKKWDPCIPCYEVRSFKNDMDTEIKPIHWNVSAWYYKPLFPILNVITLTIPTEEFLVVFDKMFWHACTMSDKEWNVHMSARIGSRRMRARHKWHVIALYVNLLAMVVLNKEDQGGTVALIHTGFIWLNWNALIVHYTASHVIYWPFHIVLFLPIVSMMSSVHFFHWQWGSVACGTERPQLTALLASPLMSCLLTCLPPTIEWSNKTIYLSPNENF